MMGSILDVKTPAYAPEGLALQMCGTGTTQMIKSFMLSEKKTWHEPHTTWFENVFSSVYFVVSGHRVYIVKCTYCNKRKTNYHQITIQRVNEILELGCNFCHPSVFVEDQTGGQEKGNNSHKQDRDRCNLKAVTCLWGPLDEISIVRLYHLVVVAKLRWKIASRDIIGWFQGLRLIYNIPIGKLQAEAPMANDFRGILLLSKSCHQLE